MLSAFGSSISAQLDVSVWQLTVWLCQSADSLCAIVSTVDSLCVKVSLLTHCVSKSVC